MMEIIEELDKTKLNEIYPPISSEETKRLLSEIDPEIGLTLPDQFEFEELPDDAVKIIYQIYILKALNTIPALKARFIQFLEISDEFENFSVLGSEYLSENEKDIDLVIKNSATNQLFWVLFFDFFDKNARNRVNELISQKIIELSLASIPKTLPNGLLLICDRLERRIAKDFQKIECCSQYNSRILFY